MSTWSQSFVELVESVDRGCYVARKLQLKFHHDIVHNCARTTKLVFPSPLNHSTFFLAWGPPSNFNGQLRHFKFGRHSHWQDKFREFRSLVDCLEEALADRFWRRMKKSLILFLTFLWEFVFLFAEHFQRQIFTHILHFCLIHCWLQ